MSWYFILSIVSSCSAVAAWGGCSSPPLESNQCGFYRTCLESFYPCGEHGYALGYGEKYCERFSDPTSFECMDSAGDEWIDSTLSCLQISLVPIIEGNIEDISCRSIKVTAFDAHPVCYTGGGGKVPAAPSICFLAVSDWKCVLDIIDPKDLVTPLALEQDVEVARICIEQLRHAGMCDNTSAVARNSRNSSSRGSSSRGNRSNSDSSPFIGATQDEEKEGENLCSYWTNKHLRAVEVYSSSIRAAITE